MKMATFWQIHLKFFYKIYKDPLKGLIRMQKIIETRLPHYEMPQPSPHKWWSLRLTSLFQKAGANPGFKDKAGRHSLHWAAHHGHVRCLKSLLNSKSALAHCGWLYKRDTFITKYFNFTDTGTQNRPLLHKPY